MAGSSAVRPPELSSTEKYHKYFDAEGHLSARYSEVDEACHGTVLKGLHELFSGGASGLKILEVGCGPVIAFQISAAPFASEIVMADLVESCRDAVQLWLDKSPSAHDWTPFFRYVVQTLEGKGEEEVARREEQLRNAVKAVVHCNALEDPPVPPGYEGPYDIVVETSLFASICNTAEDLTLVLVRLLKLIKPGGKLVSKTNLIEGASTATHTYTAGDDTFVALNISEEMLRAALTQAGFSDICVIRSSAACTKQLRIRESGIPPESTYSGAAFISAVKAH